MNATLLTEVKTQPRWFPQHGKFYYNIMGIFWSLLGALPGLAMLVVFCLMQQNHVPMTALQTVCFLMASCVVVTFGLLLGTIAGCLTFLAEKLCGPDASNPQQK